MPPGPSSSSSNRLPDMSADTTLRRPLPERRLPPIRSLPPIGAQARSRPATVANATVIERDDLTPSVARFTIRPDVPTAHVEPGQYLTLGLPVDGRILQRPYSTASPAGPHDELEFLIRLVPNGALTPWLWKLGVGDRLHLGPPKGLFRRLPGDDRTHLFIATGTGLAPFVAMTATLLGGSSPPRVVMIHGVAHAPELAYRERFEHWHAGGSVTYLPAVSRPEAPANAGWRGLTGRIDAILPSVCAIHDLDPDRTVAYLCGNPAMIDAASTALAAYGLADDAIRSEQYWPA